MKRTALARSVAALAGAAFVWALTLSAWPTLHDQVHPDAKRADHVCAVTILASGSFEQSSTPAPITANSAHQDFESVPVLTPHWVASLFLSASIFEHAPPAVS